MPALKMSDSHVSLSSAESNGKEATTDVPFWSSMRFRLAVLGFFGSINLYALRINLSVAMVCMVNQTAVRAMRQTVNVTGQDLASNETSCDTYSNATAASESMDGEFVWSRSTQGILLGAFFWGYLVTQIPGGILASKFGAKRTLGFFMFISSVATLLTPVAARSHYVFLIVIRIIVGLGSGMWFPGFHVFWSLWAPPMERSKLIGFTYGGTQLGNILTLPLAGILCKYGFDGGWSCIFYLLGISSFVWVCVWMWLASDAPSTHRYISKPERDYIARSLNGQVFEKEEKLRLKDFPLKAVLTSMPFWAVFVMNVTNDWGSYTFMTQIPTYMNDVLKFDITTMGFMTALPYVGFWIISMSTGFPADYLRSRGYVTTTTVRKICNMLGNTIPACLIIGVGFLDCRTAVLVVALLTIGISCVGFVFCGYVINHVDIAPKYSGILFGLTNTAAAATGFVAPYINGLITDDQSRESWQLVFYICAAVFLFGAIFNLIFTSGSIQPWAMDRAENHAKKHDMIIMQKPMMAVGDAMTEPA